MPAYGPSSQRKVDTCHREIKLVCSLVIKDVDCKALYGHRSRAEQYRLFLKKRSKLDGRTRLSYHNYLPSLAIDLVPFPVQWPDAKGLSEKDVQERLKRFHVFGGFVMGVARTQGIDLFWGGDWDRDWIYIEHTFHDLPHFELRLRGRHI